MPEVPHITVKLRQLSPYPVGEQIKPEDGIYIWEEGTGILRQANISQLPVNGGGGGGPAPALLGSPFKVRRIDPNFSQDGADTLISDSRLVGQNDYPVSTSQLNIAAFRDIDLVYNAINGTVRIKDFTLNPDEFIILYPDGVPASSSIDFDALLNKITQMELMLAPFLPSITGANGGRVIWNKPINQIPAGWIPDEDFNGMTAVGQLAGDTEFGTMGGTFGSKNRTLLAGNLPDFSYVSNGFKENSNNWRSGGSASAGDGTGYNTQFTLNYTGGKQAFSIIQPSRIVKYIKYVGL